MVVREELSVFTGFKVRESGSMLPQKKIEFSEVQEHYFRHSGRPFYYYRCSHHNTHIQIEINKA